MKLLNKDEFIANEMKYYFIRNHVKEGEKLPSERDLSKFFGVQRATVRAACEILEEEGIISIKERTGRYLGHSRITINLQEIKSFSDEMSEIGVGMESKLLAYNFLEVDKELSRKMKLPIGTPVNKIIRVRKAVWGEKVVPVAIEYAYIPEEMAPKLMKYDLEENSLFAILSKEYGRIPKRDAQIIEIVYANEFESNTLKVDKLTALVKKSGITYDKDDNVLLYLHAIMNKEWLQYEQSNEIIEKKVNEVLHHGL